MPKNILQFVLSLSLGLALLTPSTVMASHRDNEPTELESGIKGKVKTVVCETNRRCTRIDCDDEYVSATLIIRNSAGQEVTRVTSSDNGRFEVGLVPGTYTLAAESGKGMFPNQVTVEEDDFERVKFFINQD